MTNSTPQRWKNHTLSLSLIPAANLSVVYHLFLSLWPALPATELLIKKQGYKIVIQELNYAKQTNSVGVWEMGALLDMEVSAWAKSISP